jgi:hypothetical protein
MSATAARHLCSRSIAYRRLNPRVDDFSHHASGIARLNNGSTTARLARRQSLCWKRRWRTAAGGAPTQMLHIGIGSSSLDTRLAAAAAVATGAPAGSVALVENATVNGHHCEQVG